MALGDVTVQALCSQYNSYRVAWIPLAKAHKGKLLQDGWFVIQPYMHIQATEVKRKDGVGVSVKWV